ncbi:tyrosine-type recombinase/integrase [Enterococcus sp. 5H]|uniref:tyrosine-type recombinase/integrase n=1 Tax=Enterococcus sp. 5H TaxID=1229490 RepID=UPI003FA5546D
MTFIQSINKSKSEYLFINDYGNPVNNKSFNKYLEKMCQEAKIPRITSHAFRHAKTDLLLLASSDIIYLDTVILLSP